MKHTPRIIAFIGALTALSFATLFAEDAPATPPAAPESPAQTVPVTVTATTASATPDTNADKASRRPAARARNGNGNEEVTIGSDIHVRPGQVAREAVAIMGNITLDGDTREAVAIVGSVTANTKVNNTVSILGSTTINDEARESVAVVGNVYVNGHVTGQVVAVCGGVILGPDARVDGNIVAIGGGLQRAETAVVNGQIQQIKLFNDLSGFNAWVTKALGYARPLAFGAGLGWAWMVAGIFLLIYILTALIFPKAVSKCAETLELHPGYVFLAAVLTAIIKPIVTLVLAATGVGTLLLVFLLPALAIFGKTTFLAWFGRRVTLRAGLQHPAPAVLLGGVLLALLYCVPVLGILLWKFTAFLGTGAVIYAIIRAMRARREARAAALAAQKAALAATTAPAVIAPETAPAPAVQIDSLAPRAGFWIRLAAVLIDLAVVFLFAMLCHILKFFPALFTLYCLVMWIKRGTTLGGIICGLKVVRLDGRPITWLTAAVRMLSGFVSIASLGLGYIWIAFDSENQAWHDKIAGTVVVHSKGQPLV